MWRRITSALTAAAMTLVTGTWAPYVPPHNGPEDEEDDYSSPPPIHEGHPFPSVPDAPVSLHKHKHHPAADPAHSKPTPKVIVHPTPRPVPRPVKVPVKVAPPPTSATQILVGFLHAQVGKGYILGGNGPDLWDCSGLTKVAFAKVGVHLPRTSQQQSLVGTRVSLTELRVGDLLFWGAPGLAYHVAVYIGGGRYIAAQNPATGVVQLTIAYYAPSFARRVL